MELTLVIVLSVLIQLLAAVMALRLIRITGGKFAWQLIAFALLLMVVRRAIPLYNHLVGVRPYPRETSYELLGLLLSSCMLVGIAWIAPYFLSVRRLEEKARRSEARYRGIVDTAEEGIWLLDAEGKTTLVNRRMAEMIGYDEGEMTGRSLFDFVDDPLREEMKERLGRRRLGVKEQYDFRLSRKDGSKIWVLVSGAPVVDGQGCFVGSLGMVTDISDRKRMEEEREKLIGELREALANVKTLSGLLPICAVCKKIRDDKGYWNRIEEYLHTHSEAELTHSYCPECARKLYPGLGQ